MDSSWDGNEVCTTVEPKTNRGQEKYKNYKNLNVV